MILNSFNERISDGRKFQKATLLGLSLKRLQLMSFCWNTITEEVLISGSRRGVGLMIRDALVHTLGALSLTLEHKH